MNKASKAGMCTCKTGLPSLYGHVVVLGAGDTAFDCATSAFRCGAKRVTVAFRRAFRHIRAVPEEVDIAKNEACDFLPYTAPKRVVVGENNHISHIEFYRMEEQDDGNYVLDQGSSPHSVKAAFFFSNTHKYFLSLFILFRRVRRTSLSLIFHSQTIIK